MYVVYTHCTSSGLMLVYTYLRVLGDNIFNNSWEEIRTVLALGNHLRWEWEGEEGRERMREGRG